MHYVIANSPSPEIFGRDIAALRDKLVPFTFDYIVQTSDPMLPGGWGCVRFEFPAPASQIFLEPNVEYRFSDAEQKWTVDGFVPENWADIQGVYDYFLSLEGGQK